MKIDCNYSVTGTISFHTVRCVLVLIGDPFGDDLLFILLFPIISDDPFGDPKVIGDPYCTVFVGRLSRETEEKTLKEVFLSFFFLLAFCMVLCRIPFGVFCNLNEANISVFS